MSDVQSQEFLNGWTAAEQDEAAGRCQRTQFPQYRTGAFIEGYSAFFEKQDAELAAAERECVADYDNGPGKAVQS